MRTYRFFVESPLVEGERIRLPAEQARQIRAVLRLRPGDALELFDEAGAVGSARLIHVARDDAEAQIEQVQRAANPVPLDLTVGLALLRGERFDLAIQKLTEIGASSIVPLRAQHCVVSYAVGREWDRRASRLRRIAIEAAEQSERTTIPRIAEPTSVEGFLAGRPVASIAALVERRPGAPPLLDIRHTGSIALMIGPEGGWSEDERAMIVARSQPVSLGTLILRAETAAIVAAGALMQCAWASKHHEYHEEEG